MTNARKAIAFAEIIDDVREMHQKIEALHGPALDETGRLLAAVMLVAALEISAALDAIEILA